MKCAAISGWQQQQQQKKENRKQVPWTLVT